ncbi:hypothetical protein MKW98_007699 [Papaver atlanticum]|uniref:Uncharacterized protein n=1 Tax=Papaver atlanticum TaxID=357466 RepID=A0AAD4X8N5_9MAGN|nr:hypothetical protein MKW98_007699 [Papaver atlanticum]
MVRFSCFHTHIPSYKSKKAIQRPTEGMHNTFQKTSLDQQMKVSAASHSNLKALGFDKCEVSPSMASITCPDKVTSSPASECYWKSQEMHSASSPEEFNPRTHLNKSRSVGSGLDREGRISRGSDIEDETGEGFSCDDPHRMNYDRSFDGSDHSGLEEPSDSPDPETDLFNKYNEALDIEPFQENNHPGHSEHSFTSRESEQLERHSDDSEQLERHSDNSGLRMPMIEKSCSMPNFEDILPDSEEVSPSHLYSESQGRCSQNLDKISVKGKEVLSYDDCYQATTDQENDDKFLGSDNDKNENDNSFSDEYDSCGGVTKDWVNREIDKVDTVKDLQSESSVNLDELPSKDFKIKRIEDWVSTIDLEDRIPLQETGGEPSYSMKVKKASNILGAANLKLDAKSSIEVAKTYISSLAPTSASAQMVNLGLVVIPFLSAFVSLRVLNLSGNSIVRITAGALPRGLHVLNLSKNNISTIEGLRELTRLRILDLSYNRISRIGHGLASCSSLKELYLAGNKISEVEGLHRLLKLNILDLRFNKISTSKCLGQLAANYISLQTISLEGNPAQKNVGDEQIKKYLSSLLPHLVYYNKKSIKANSSKEVAERTARSAPRKGAPSVASSSKVSSSSIHGRLISQAVSSLKPSKGRHGRIPHISGTAKGISHHPRNHYPDPSERLLSLQANLSMRRSHSEGFLGAA